VKGAEFTSATLLKSRALGANDLGLKVVAKGIETDELLSELKSIGSEFGQGYFFPRPLDSRFTSALLSESITAVEDQNDYLHPIGLPLRTPNNGRRLVPNENVQRKGE
jgi:predicted signal transduction protein with EAL and GGDEF domain